MAIKTRADLKAYFQTGDRPSQNQFEDLIDSFVHVDESGLNNIILEDLQVSGNIIPSTPDDGFTSSFSLGSPTAAWKDLFVSEDSIKFIKNNSGISEELARITIDTGSGKMQFKGLTDHKDLELRQTQFGKNPEKGAVINDGGGPSSTDVRFSMQSKETGINGGAFVFRPEFPDLGYLGSDQVRNAFTFKGTGSAAMVLNATPSSDGIRGDANFKVQAHAEFDSIATQLFTINELKKYKFHGSDGILTIEGKSSLSGSQVLSASNTSGKPAANFEIDVASAPQVAGFQIGMGNNNPITANSELLSYYDVSNSMFDTNSAATSFLAYGALGIQMANNPNVIIENGVISTSGIISASMVIGQILNPAITELTGVGDDCHIIISEGVVVRILTDSVLKIQCPQPDIITDSSTGTVTLSDPNIMGGGDITIAPDNGGNPTVLFNQSVTIPSNQVAYWTEGTNVPGTFVSPDSTPPSNPSTGIQIGAGNGVLFNGIFINGEEILPAFGATFPPFNIQLIIEDGAELYIQPPSLIVPIEDGTNITGTTTLDGNLIQEGGTTFIMGDSSEDIDSGATLSENTPGGLVVSSAPGTAGLSQDGEIGGVIIAEQVVDAPNLINRAIVTSSLTLTIAEHGNGKKVYIRSGSTPREGLETSLNLSPGLPYYALPSQPQSVPPLGIDGHENSDHPNGDHDLCGAYLRQASDGPAGTLRIELPSASVGEVIYFQSMQFKHGGSDPFLGPDILITPNGSNQFMHKIAGGTGVPGKGVIIASGSSGLGQYYAKLTVHCMSHATWSIALQDGEWTDEP